MITNNVIQRVFKFKYKNQTGTCFIIDIEDKQYFVTAKHVFQIQNERKEVVETLKLGETVEIVYKNKWTSFLVVDVRHSKKFDVSIFTISNKIPAHPLPASSDGLSYGQDLYFLGFPYGMSSDIGEVNRNFPLPLVRKGIMSSMSFFNKGEPFLIDGHNNPGFSGGPVVFKKSGEVNFNVAGVIHGYSPEFKNENGQLIPIENTNSGLVVVYPINIALDLIKEIS